MSTSTATPADQARAIRALASVHNVRVTAHNGGVVTVTARFEPGDEKAYAEAERSCNAVLSMVRQTRAGSVWGSTSDGVGGLIAINRGVYTLNKSGADKRVIKILAK
jgi:hypothetical protein